MSTVPKILVADDSLTIRKLVERVLCQEGYDVITAETGADCLTQAAQHKPNLILLDYILPDMQGTEICRSLINSPETWEIPVLMMSSNGNAIRQLYHDLNNVADYLTKPFAPSVLNAVVGHLLQKDSLTELGETSTISAVAAPATPAAPAAEGAVPSEFMDKVSRLINLMESKPVVPGSPAENKEAEAPVAARPKAPRKRKAVSTAPASDKLQRKFRLAMQKFLRARARQIPEWEAARAGEEAEEYFLARLLAKDALRDLSAELVKITGAPPEMTEGLRCPAVLAPLDAVLRHMHDQRVTGELRIETAEETILALFDKGEVVFLTTNHPRNYCAGAACDFQAVPHAEIGEAVRAQEEQSVPFFISLDMAGHLPPGASRDDLLRVQGQKCLARAFKAVETVATFHPLKKLPAVAKQYRIDVPLNQWLLACYRVVDDWFTLEKLFPEMDATLSPSPEIEEQKRELTLEAEETRAIGALQPGQTIPELAAVLQLKPFEVCRILYRFVKLGLVSQGAPRPVQELDNLANNLPIVTAKEIIAAEPPSAPVNMPATAISEPALNTASVEPNIEPRQPSIVPEVIPSFAAAPASVAAAAVAAAPVTPVAPAAVAAAPVTPGVPVVAAPVVEDEGFEGSSVESEPSLIVQELEATYSFAGIKDSQAVFPKPCDAARTNTPAPREQYMTAAVGALNTPSSNTPSPATPPSSNAVNNLPDSSTGNIGCSAAPMSFDVSGPVTTPDKNL